MNFIFSRHPDIIYLVTSVEFNDRLKSIWINGMKLSSILEDDYEYAKRILVVCISSDVKVVHEDAITDGNASHPAYDMVYESLRHLTENSEDK